MAEFDLPKLSQLRPWLCLDPLGINFGLSGKTFELFVRLPRSLQTDECATKSVTSSDCPSWRSKPLCLSHTDIISASTFA
jgi:hypothetical protein